jgi:hypothetical protein
MKKIALIFSLLTVSLFAFSQEVRLNLYSGYVFDDAVDSRYDAFNYYAGTVKGAYQWGAGMEVMAAPKTGIEASFQRMNTTMPLNYYKVGAQSTTFNLSMNQLMLGVNRYYRADGSMAEFFTGAQVGMLVAGWKNPTSYQHGTLEKLSWGLKAGLNIWPMENVGIKLQAQFQSTYRAIGDAFYYSSSASGITTASSLYQIGIGGGVIFRFPKTN